MKRIVMAIAATAAVVPAALGLLGNESFAQSLPTAVPASVQLVSSSSSTPAGTADDNGGDRTTPPPGAEHGETHRRAGRRPAAHVHLIEHERLVLEHDRIVVEHLVPVILERLHQLVLLHLRRLGQLRRQLGLRLGRQLGLWLGLWLRLGRQLGLGFGFLGRRQR
jgi:hypothetical protein